MSINHQIIGFTKCFTDEQCDSLIKNSFVKNRSYSHSKDELHKETRPKNLVENNIFILEKEKYEWVYSRIWEVINEVNQYFEYDIDTMESISLVKYVVGDHYKKHHDLLMEMRGSRKLTISVQLNHQNEFEGGSLILHTGEVPYIPNDSKGNATIYSSYILHEVTNVSKGERFALVVHLNGPKWR